MATSTKLVSILSKTISPNDSTLYIQQKAQPIEIQQAPFTEGPFRGGGFPVQQNTETTKLILGPSECFFSQSPKQFLQCVPTSHRLDPLTHTRPEWNDQTDLTYISGLGRNLKDKIIWTIYCFQKCSLQFNVACIIRQPKTQLELKLDSHTLTKTLNPSSSNSKYPMCVQSHTVSPGLHQIEIRIVKRSLVAKLNGIGPFHYIKLSSSKPIGVVRGRWRANATHLHLRSPYLGPIQKAIFQLTPSETHNPFFAPIQFQRGYFGPVCNQGQIEQLVFSVWNPSLKQIPEPKLYQQTAFLASHNKSPHMRAFSHEGHGFKMNSSPLQNPISGFVGALYIRPLPRPAPWPRDRPGYLYMIQSFIWNHDIMEWILFGALQFFALEPLRSLRCTPFVEVVGSVESVRTNWEICTVNYRGFACDISGVWSPLTQMTRLDTPATNQGEQWTNRNWGVSDTHGFWASCGGLMQHRYKSLKQHFVQHPEPVSKWPPYAKPEVHSQFHQAQSLFPKIMQIQMDGEMIHVTVQLPTTIEGTQTVYLFRGSQDFGSWKEHWEREDVFSELGGGRQIIPLVHIDTFNWIRVVAKHEKGLFWSLESVLF